MKTREEYINMSAKERDLLPIGTPVIYKQPYSKDNFMRIGKIISYYYSPKDSVFVWDYLVEDKDGKLFWGDKVSFDKV